MRVAARAVLALVLALALGGCGGEGGGGSGPIGARGEARAAGPCAWRYYEGLLAGTYRGRASYDATAIGGPACAWEVELEIETRAYGPLSCEPSARVSGAIEQLAVAPAASDEAAECRADAGVFAVIDPASGVPDPELGVDYALPVRLALIDLDGAPDEGPYFGDEGVVRPYAWLFGGAFPLVDTLALDADGITLEGYETLGAPVSVEGRLERIEPGGLDR